MVKIPKYLKIINKQILDQYSTPDIGWRLITAMIVRNGIRQFSAERYGGWFDEKDCEFSYELPNEAPKIKKCNCDKESCVKSKNIGKFCKYRNHIVNDDYLKG